MTGNDTTDDSRLFRAILPAGDDGDDVPCDGCGESATRQCDELGEAFTEKFGVEASGALCPQCHQDLIRFVVARRIAAGYRE